MKSSNETIYLLAKPKNAERLRQAKKNTQEKNFEKHNLIEK